MNKLLLLFVWGAFPFWGLSQTNGFEVWDYKPAPGQHINISSLGTPAAAEQMAANPDKLVSLGSFGGYVILKFNEACLNDQENPYGVDFTVFGNAFSGSSEPGVVWVMQDENSNGKPDDTWFEIAGSQHFYSQSIQNSSVTYFKTETRDVFWKNNSGESGWIFANNFNLQEYYPANDFFPGYPPDSVTFEGTMLYPFIDSLQQVIKTEALAFGYADNRPRVKGIDMTVPDNPYTTEIEGAGGDPIDISWAVEENGNYVHLDSIHFVKIVTGTLANTSHLGEISTDVSWFADVAPAPEISGKENMLVVFPTSKKLVAGDSSLLEAVYFEQGRKKRTDISFSSQDELVATVDNSGKLTAQSTGETQISISAKAEVQQINIMVVEPDSIQILTDFSALYPGDSVRLEATVYDNENEKLNIPVHFSSSRPGLGQVVQQNGSYWLKAIQPGILNVVCNVEGFDLQAEKNVEVLSENEKIKLYFSLKNEDENLFPFQWIEVGEVDLMQVVENPQLNYSGLNRLTLAHAMVAGLSKVEVDFKFRDDEASGGKLYLYSVETEGIYSYGWGGKTEPESFARGWIARLNGNPFLNSFNEIEISDGDTLDLYHVSTITQPWNYSRLLTNKDSAKRNEEVEILLEQTTCNFFDGEITESGFAPLKNVQVSADDIYFTDESGKVVFIIDTEPPITVSSGNNAVFIAKKTITGIHEISQLIQVYPNPVENELTIGGTVISKSKIVLFSSTGQLLFNKEIFTFPAKVDFSSFQPGIYYLVVTHRQGTETCKIIKK
ncbi:Por secretion system C-terminal sorting domain-containing protein [Tangfeifania diversioriginum]|uniref:Por secretion system C-terminal sorting domain-containing protein n=1 Tax=Tangfeifania diversioriginum TaxID=1168035 RepID=A0A1M6LAA5_9BACT|nr:T9SS type A sorting domain-containing protein [Tangfeifania diversioriginum]SHJ68130.1 Por secretion system C-terminal sorting domain-containing protein [Tangfeifania diversioriginum]